MNIKRIKYKTETGEAFFDNIPGGELFCEEIDLTGTAGVFSSDNLVFSDGQVTTEVDLAPKTIPASFAFRDRFNDAYKRYRLEALFSPKYKGVLTVFNDHDVFSIDCRPKDIPVFKRSRDNPRIWRWDVEFSADFPYFRKGTVQNRKIITSAYTNIRSTSLCNVPIEITFCAGTPFQNQTIGASSGFSISMCGNESVTVNTQDFSVINQDGQKVNNCIDSTARLDNLCLLPGNNNIFCPTFTDGENNTVVKWWDLVTGVF